MAKLTQIEKGVAVDLAVGEEIKLGDEVKTNVGLNSCKYFPIPTKFLRTNVQRQNVKPMINKWDLVPWRADVESSKDMYIQSNDPFDTHSWASFPIRYIASLVYHIYPNGKKFHARQMHYHLLSGFCFPVRKRKGSKQWELRAYDGSKIMTNLLYEYLMVARYAGLIPMEQQVDRRTTSKVEPQDFEVKRSVPKSDSQTLDLIFQLTTGDNMRIDLQTPVIVIYTEKSEMTHILEELAKRYYLGYFVAQGQSSVPNARDVYDFIKKHGKSGIILTLTDYDRAGMTIAHALARKIQYFVQSEEDTVEAPNIVVYPFKITEKDAEEFEKLGIEKVSKPSTYNVGNKKVPTTALFYELVALEMLAVLHNMSFEDYLAEELKRIFFYLSDPKRSWLVERKEYDKYYGRQKKAMYRQLTAALQIESEKSKEKLKAEKLDFENVTYKSFQESVKQRMIETEGYKVLEKTVAGFNFEPTHLRTDLKHDVGNMWGFHGENEAVKQTDRDKKEKAEQTGYRIRDKVDGVDFDVELPILKEKEVKKRSVLWFGNSKSNVRLPTEHMQAWMKLNEQDNKDFGLGEDGERTAPEREQRWKDHLKTIAAIFNKDPEKYLKAKSMEGKIVEGLSKTGETIRTVGGAQDYIKQLGGLDVIDNSLKISSKYDNWEQWVEGNRDQKLGALDVDETVFWDNAARKYPIERTPTGIKNQTYPDLPAELKEGKFRNYTVGQLDDPTETIKQNKKLKITKSLTKGARDKGHYKAFLHAYFDRMVPFYEKGREALKDSYNLDNSVSFLLENCVNNAKLLSDAACLRLGEIAQLFK